MKKNPNLLKKLQKEIWSSQRSNGGSAIILVIIAMAMIGILATTLIWMSFINYKIKTNDIRNKNSFYSAETVMEQIVAGLQGKASEAVAASYHEVLSNWQDLENESNRYASFSSAYLDALTKELQSATLGAGYYDRELLKDFVDTAIWTSVDQADWDNGNESTEATKDPVMEIVNGNSLVLRNVFVSFTSAGRVSVISTDLCLDVPKVMFEQSNASIDQLYDYLLIGNEGIELAHSSGTVTGDGNLYAGTDASGQGGIRVNYASTLAVNNGRLVVSGGDIDVVGPSAAFVVRDVAESGSSVYAKGLDLQSGTVSLDSKTYIENDLTLSGSGSKATLTKEYYGYGAATVTGLEGDTAETDQEHSSAIIINGQNATVDMKGINTLMLAGRAYIGTSATKAEMELKAADASQKNTKAVLMGESITVKGGQMAYLVPPECMGVYKDQLLIGQNPMNQTQTAQMAAYISEYGAEFQEVYFNRPLERLGGKCLADFGVTNMSHIRKVYTQYTGGGATDKTLTYYYLVMDKDQAAAYYEQYYGSGTNRESVDRYFKKYATGGILLGDYTADDTSYTIMGNALVSDALSDSGVNLLKGSDPALHAMPVDEVTAKADEIRKTYQALTTNLSEDASTALPGQNVFSSIVKETIMVGDTSYTLENYLLNNETGVAGSMTFVTDEGLKGVITKGDYILSGDTTPSKVRLIISLGDITIDRNFEGIAIAKGKITINGSVSHGASELKRNKMELYKVLNATTGIPGSTITPLSFLVNGTSAAVTPADQPKTDEEGTLEIDYTEIVRYVNWVKK